MTSHDHPKKLRFRIAVNYESNHFLEAYTPEEALELWKNELGVTNLPVDIKRQEWIKGGFKLTVEFKTHLKKEIQEGLSDSISIDNIDQGGKEIL